MTTKVLTVRRDVACCTIRDCRWQGPARETAWEAKRDARLHDRWHESFVVVVMFSLWWGCSWEIEPMLELHEPLVPPGSSQIVHVSPLGLDRILREMGLLP